MNITLTTREVGPYKVLVNGRTVAQASTKARAERLAKAHVGAAVQGTLMQIASFA